MASANCEATSGQRRGTGALDVVAVVAATVLARLVPAVWLGIEVSDLSMYRQMALAVGRNQDIYDIPTLFHYTPLSLFAPAFALHLSSVLGQPFHLVMKMYPLAGDAGTAVLIFVLARRRWGLRRGILAGLAFAVNPVSILITGLHGQFMPLSVFFAFWAYYLLEGTDRDRTYVLSALALGVAIALRGWPLLLVPFLLRPGVLRTRQRITYLGLAAFPSVITLAPYLAVNLAGISREVFNYQSTPDFGWVGIWRNLWFLQTGFENLPGSVQDDWLSRSRFLFLAAYAAIIGVAYLRPYAVHTADWIIATLLLSYTLLGGLAAQYFGWIIPFLVFRPYYGAVFSLVAAAAMVAFYLTWHPQIILGPYPPPFDYTRPEIVRWYLGFQAATWVVGVLWLLWFIFRLITTKPDGPAPVTVGVRTTPRHSYWVTAGSTALVAGVLGTVLLEVPYLQRSRPAPELPASIVWAKGAHGTEPGSVVAPIGLAVAASGDIYVADLGSICLQRFSPTGEFLSRWPAADSEAVLKQPSDVVVGAAGDVYALDAEGAIYRLEPNGRVTLAVPLVPLGAFSPRAMALDEVRHRFYVSDTGNGRILVLGKEGLIDVWGGEGENGWQFEDPAGMGLDRAGNLFVLELRNSRIRKISPHGELLAEWLAKGALYDLAVGADDRVYVTAVDHSRLWVYSNGGEMLGQVTAPFTAASVPQGQSIAVPTPGTVILGTESSLVRVSIQFTPERVPEAAAQKRGPNER